MNSDFSRQKHTRYGRGIYGIAQDWADGNFACAFITNDHSLTDTNQITMCQACRATFGDSRKCDVLRQITSRPDRGTVTEVNDRTFRVADGFARIDTNAQMWYAC
jgi:hypothetical protein